MTVATLDSIAIPQTMRWSAYQLAIFANVANGTGHTVVDAKAGSGKTSTLMEALHRVPEDCTVFLAAFSKTTAEELKTRAPRGVDVGTLHSYGFRAIAKGLDRGVKLQVDKNRSLALCEQRFGALQAHRTESPWRADTYRAVCKLVGLAKGALIATRDGLDRLADDFDITVPSEVEDPDEATVMCERAMFLTMALDILEQSKRSTSVIDFDDMVWLPVVWKMRTWQYDRVFIDETQDLNAAQVALAKMACRRDGRILAVGDPRQAIYAFRGADEHAMENLTSSLGATVLPLSVCYRCDQSIIAEAQRYVPEIEAAPDAAPGSVTEIEEKKMIEIVKSGDFILSRSNAPLVKLCLQFLRAGRAANIQGRDVGEGLVAFVRASKKVRIDGLVAHIERWRDRELRRLAKKVPPQDTSLVLDKAETLLALCAGCGSAAEVIARIQTLFVAAGRDGQILLSSTHRAKGLERDTVFMLRDTFLKRDTVEESNLAYVAITRARHTLYYVAGEAK